jgi:SPP1 gp7 family putative phage head morphogenesis protein
MIDTKLLAIEDKGILAAVHIYSEMVLAWIKQIKFKDTFQEAIELATSGSLRFDNRFSILLGKALTVGYLQGLFRAKQEVAYQWRPGRLPQAVTFADLTGDFDFAHSTYEEAIEWLQSKGIVSPEEFRQMSSMLKQISFSIQGVEQKRILEAVKDSIEAAMHDGTPYRQWAKNVDKVFDNYGVTPLSSWHLEAVYRTNLQSVYHIAKHENFEQDDNVTGYEVSGIDDDRTCDICGPMIGFRAAKDDPVWNTWWPPNHYNDRCTVIPLTDYYMKAHDLEFNTELPEGATAPGADFNQKCFTLDQYYAIVRGKQKSV